MRLRLGMRVAAVALALCSCAGLASADRLVVAGQEFTARTPFALAAGDVFVPLLTALEPLATSHTVTQDSIKITTRGGREISISRQRPEATLDGMLREMPALPKSSGNTLLLPAKAVGSLLGCAVRWSPLTRTLYLHPWVKRFALETTPNSYRVVVVSEQPLTHRVEKMNDPPRLVLDLPNTDLPDIPKVYTLEENSYLYGARIAQRSLAPDRGGDVTRVVIELKEWRSYRIETSEDRTRLTLELPLPGEELPSNAPPVTLTDLACRRFSPHLTSVTLSTSDKAQFRSGASADPPSVWVDVDNAENKVRLDRLLVKDRLISRVSLGPNPTRKGAQRLTLTLTETTPYAIANQENALRIMLGRCELSDLTVVVDPGHGGVDPGAVGRSGLTEKEVNLDIAVRLTQLLEAAGAKVILTRCDDDTLQAFGSSAKRDQLLARCNIANAATADLFVSIHCNARGANSASLRGTETYYRKKDSLPFARVMQEELVAALGIPDNGALYHPKSIIVLYRTDMPSVLVEVAYLSNREDEALLATPDFRDRAAQGIANGVKRYVQESSLSTLLLDRQDSSVQPLPARGEEGE